MLITKPLQLIKSVPLDSVCVLCIRPLHIDETRDTLTRFYPLSALFTVHNTTHTHKQFYHSHKNHISTSISTAIRMVETLIFPLADQKASAQVTANVRYMRLHVISNSFNIFSFLTSIRFVAGARCIV